MAVLSANLIEQRGTQDDKNVRSYLFVYLVICDSKTETPVSVLSSLMIPPAWYAYPADPFALVKRREAVQNKGEDNAHIWTVTCEFSTACEDQRFAEDDPLDEPTRWSRSTVKGEKVFDKDIHGDAVVNAVGDAFDPPILIPDSHTIFKAVKNYATFDDNEVENYINTVNETTFLGKDPLTIRCNGIDVEEAYKNGQRYFVYSFEFEYKSDGWNAKPLNEGINALDLSGGYYRVLDKDGQPKQTTTKLDADGYVIDNDDLPEAAVYLEFDTYFEADFNDFNL